MFACPSAPRGAVATNHMGCFSIHCHRFLSMESKTVATIEGYSRFIGVEREHARDQLRDIRRPCYA